MIYIARLSCGCAISSCDDESDLLWFYLCRGNGWTIEAYEPGQEIDMECDEAKGAHRRETQRMF